LTRGFRHRYSEPMAVSPLAGRTALVTGAAKRLGRAIAEALAAEGAHLLLHYRTSGGEAERLASSLRARGVQAWPVRGDLAQPAQVEALWAAAVTAAPQGRIELLVNSASVFPVDSLGQLQEQRLAEPLRINALAPARLAALLAGQQGLEQGSVVNLLDSRMHGHMRRHLTYNLSKQALLALTRMMALEYAPRVRVNAVAPGFVLPPPGSDERSLARLVATVPLQRWGKPEETAQAVTFLLGAQYITGQVIYVDGGRFLNDGLLGR
jgi:pteridine reductase